MQPSPTSTAGVAVTGAPSAERQLQDLQVILGVARALAAALDLDTLLALILNAARQILNAERATLFLYDPASNEIYSKIAHGTGEIRFPATAGIAGAAAQTRQMVNIPDAYADPRFNREVDRKTGYHTRCLLTVPLVGTDDQLVGVVQVLNKTDGFFTPYDERLAEALAAQVGVAIQRARLMEHYVEKKQMEHSLAIARDIQQGLLPKHPPRIPGYEIAAWSHPTEQTGGDCYDFIPLSGNRLAVSLADATGHGVGAALMISEMRALLRATTGHVEQVADILVQVNRWMCADLLEGRFVTAFLGVLDPAGHQMDYASAGHGPLLWYRAASREVASTGSTGLPLGMLEPLEFDATAPIRFAPGDMGVLLTDGFIEAQDPAGAQFGKERLCRTIVEHAERPAAEVIRALDKAVHAFMAGGPQLDDLTAVVVKRCA